MLLRHRRNGLALLVWCLLSLAPAASSFAICGDTVLDGGEQCDDGNTVGGDCCSATCQFETNGSACIVDACNTGGTCNATGVCGGTSPVACDDGAFCNGAESCDPGLGCQAGTPPVIDDGIACTDDSCDEVGDVVVNATNDSNCDDGLLCNGAETCSALLDCQPDTQPGLGALFRGDIVAVDPRASAPSLDPFVLLIDPITGAQTTLSEGGVLTDPRDVAVESNRCVLVPDDNNSALIRVDPLTYNPLFPADNQVIVSQFGNLDSPRGITIGPDGAVYVTDFASSSLLHRIDPFTGAQELVGRAGHLDRPRRITIGPDGLLYVPVYTGISRPAIVRVDPDSFNPVDDFDNQEIVAQGGLFNTINGPWDVAFDENDFLIVLNAQAWNLIRVDVDNYNPLDQLANQELVGDGGTFTDMRGLTFEEAGTILVSDEGNSTVVRVDPDSFDIMNQGSNQTILASGAPMIEPRGIDVVGIGSCGNGVLDAGEQCDDGGELNGDCCSDVCAYEPNANACDIDACSTGGTCNATGSCLGTTPVICDDTLFCNGAETCDSVQGCLNGVAPVIDDGVVCTDDSCDEVGDVVVNAVNDANCDNSLFCDGAETCHATLDCQAGTPPIIDDGVACTIDSCDEVGDIVVNAPDNGFCSDGTFCNGVEACDPVLGCQASSPPQPGRRRGVHGRQLATKAGDVVVNARDRLVSATTALFCDGAETCDLLLDCQAGAPPTNDDGVVCTDEICDEVGDVVNNVANDANCDDTLLCNGLETCDPVLDCQLGAVPGTGALFFGDIVVADPRTVAMLDPLVLRVDPVSGVQTILSEGGLLTEPRDLAVEANRCVLVPDDNISALIRIDPLTYNPLFPGDNQVIVSQFGNLDSPRGISIAPNGDVYVTDYSSDDLIHRIDPITGAQEVVAQEGHISRPRRVTVGPDGLLYVPVYTGTSKPAIARIDPDAFNPLDLVANQEIVASGGHFNTNNGPWDVAFDENDFLILLNAQQWNVIRVDVDDYNPLNELQNQEIVADGGSFNEMRGISFEAGGTAILSDEGNDLIIRVDPDNFNAGTPGSNQTIVATGGFMTEPRGLDVVGMGICGNGFVDPGEQCDDGNEIGGDCCSAVCGFETSGNACDAGMCFTGGAGTCDGAGACDGTTPVICDDGAFCNGAESCDPVLGCQAGTPPVIDDGVVCTDDSCDEVGDIVVNAANDANCDNALFCDGSETCDATSTTVRPGTCTGGIDDGVGVHQTTACDEVADAIVNAPERRRNCDNGLFCDGSETCHATLDCQAGTPPPLSDGVGCTDDVCDEVGDTVVHLPNNANCDNALFCDGSETCHITLDCQAGTPPVIDDAVACTDDSCDEVGDVVVNAPNDANCDNSLFCDGTETCHATLDCQAGTPPVIDDAVACTDDSCDEVGDVVVNAPNNANCDNALFCDGSETCHATLDCQSGTPPDADDGIDCTDDTCDEVGDVIVNTPNDTNCDNALFCDGLETCHISLDCQAGRPPVIDDAVACTDDSCDEVGDVVVNAPNNANCDNSLFCDGAETCHATLDCQAGTPPVIDDAVTCTDDSCDEVGDVVVNTPNNANCDNSLFCDGAETCHATLDCQAGTPPVIDDAVACTDDSAPG